MRTSWYGIKHFKPNSKIDNWGRPEEMSVALLVLLDEFREFIGAPVFVTSGFRAGSNSEHGRGEAVDIVVPKYKDRLLDLYLAAERFNFTGIGLYPNWFYGDEDNIVGGLHLDVGERIGRWIGVKNAKTEKNIYYGLNEHQLMVTGILSKEF